MKPIKILVLTNDKILITQIEEVTTELGEPDCKLIEPFALHQDGTMSPWLVDVTGQNTFMIHSDKILTIADPNGKLTDKYTDLVK
jgi:hypothetical protein|tara:strand:- start:212 stop:466 length:255 start_codon:yes stop_codon:yes gene_type:complete